MQTMNLPGQLRPTMLCRKGYMFYWSQKAKSIPSPQRSPPPSQLRPRPWAPTGGPWPPCLGNTWDQEHDGIGSAADSCIHTRGSWAGRPALIPLYSTYLMLMC